MKKCSYCGAECPDDAVVCALDHTPLGREGEAVETRTNQAVKYLVFGATALFGAVFLLIVGVLVLAWALDLDRSREFSRRIRQGRPLVRAIERFRADTGNYPQSLDDLPPKYLTGIATNAKDLRAEFWGWSYYLRTNDEKVSYTLGDWNLGHASIEYTPSNWTGNVDGNYRIVRKGL